VKKVILSMYRTNEWFCLNGYMMPHTEVLHVASIVLDGVGPLSLAEREIRYLLANYIAENYLQICKHERKQLTANHRSTFGTVTITATAMMQMARPRILPFARSRITMTAHSLSVMLIECS